MQLIIVRILGRMNIQVFVSFSIYVIGLFLLIFINFNILPLEFPYTSILVYILLTSLLITFSFVPLLRLQSPSSVIMTMLQKEKKITFKQLQNGFDEKKLILDRINDLCKIGLVKNEKTDTVFLYRELLLVELLKHFV